jgi:hypothetical protein
MMEDNMTPSKPEAKNKTKIIFEKLTLEEEKKVRGSGTPEPYNCKAGLPTLFEC